MGQRFRCVPAMRAPKGPDHFLLMFGGLRHDVVVFHLRGGQIQLVGGLDVRHFFEQVHQLRQVEKLANRVLAR